MNTALEEVELDVFVLASSLFSRVVARTLSPELSESRDLDHDADLVIGR